MTETGFKSGSFKLYETPRASPNASCDVHTKLDLVELGQKANLRNVVSGTCEIAVPPNAREYELQLAGNNCGTLTYTGTAGDGSSIKVTDNRARICEDVVSAAIVVEETLNSETRTLYSYDSGSAPDTSGEPAVKPGDFKLYKEPRVTPDANCDVHTALSLTSTNGSNAHLENRLSGSCEIVIRPTPRDYALQFAGTDCGTVTYTGTASDGSSVKVTDNRARTCEDVVPAAIVIEETMDWGTETLYSYDGQ